MALPGVACSRDTTELLLSPNEVNLNLNTLHIVGDDGSEAVCCICSFLPLGSPDFFKKGKESRLVVRTSLLTFFHSSCQYNVSAKAPFIPLFLPFFRSHATDVGAVLCAPSPPASPHTRAMCFQTRKQDYDILIGLICKNRLTASSKWRGHWFKHGQSRAAARGPSARIRFCFDAGVQIDSCSWVRACLESFQKPPSPPSGADVYNWHIYCCPVFTFEVSLFLSARLTVNTWQ